MQRTEFEDAVMQNMTFKHHLLMSSGLCSSAITNNIYPITDIEKEKECASFQQSKLQGRLYACF